MKQDRHSRQIEFKDVQEFLRKQRTYSLFRPRLTKFPKNRSLAIPGPNYLLAIDIWELRRFSDKIKPPRGRKVTSKNPPNYALVAIDGFSKRIVAVPMVDKSQESVIQALSAILQAGFRFRVLYSDNDRAFTGIKTQNFLKENEVAHRTSSTFHHCYLAERAIQALSKKLRRLMFYQRTFNWIKPLALVVKSYNDTPHSQLANGKYTPNQVTVFNAPEIYDYMYKNPQGPQKRVKKVQPWFNVGDTVLLTRPKELFRKGYEPSWMPQLYTVAEVLTNRPRPMYRLHDTDGDLVQGNFYNEQLQKVTSRR